MGSGQSLYPGGVSRTELEARLRGIRNDIRQLASEAASVTARTVITTYIAQTIKILNYSDLQGIPTTFTPSAHAVTHAVGGSDVLTPAAIGVIPAYDQALGFVGVPVASALTWALVGRASTISAASPGSAYARVLPTAAWTAIIQVNGVSQGTIQISTAGVITWGIGADIVLVAGDRLELVAPNPADATAADIQVVLEASLS